MFGLRQTQSTETKQACSALKAVFAVLYHQSERDTTLLMRSSGSALTATTIGLSAHHAKTKIVPQNTSDVKQLYNAKNQ